ncbi:helix-turn-helix transcriptional regulator [Sphingobacterium suaedae]|uniref:Helix-turn-helix transcriptional regulator n=1 Tax=Sphingobacterium suaedae TaxID=1686402 RepID=A0ABW5KHB4_9SPHI
MSKQRIYAGMIDKGIEFFEDLETKILYCSHDMRQYRWPHFPKNVMREIKKDMLRNPQDLKYLAQWPNLRSEDRVYRYILCKFGGLDDEPDINSDGKVHHSEYYECGLRGKCPFEGKLCSSIKVANGYLTKAELEILRFIRLPDKQIAQILNKSPETVSSQMQSIRTKTGEVDKVNLAIFAIEKGINLYNPKSKNKTKWRLSR